MSTAMRCACSAGGATRSTYLLPECSTRKIRLTAPPARIDTRVRARVSVEAAATFGWHRWVGDLGEAIGMETFGASAPAGALYKHFGFTSERVAERGRAVVERVKAN